MLFGTTMLSLLAATAEAAEIEELEKLEELQFKADPDLAKAILVTGHAFYSNMDKLAAKSKSAFVKAMIDGGRQAIEQEAAIHGIILS